MQSSIFNLKFKALLLFYFISNQVLTILTHIILVRVPKYNQDRDYHFEYCQLLQDNEMKLQEYDIIVKEREE